MLKQSGVIRETCSCGASIEMPATMMGRVVDWRRNHRHKPAEASTDEEDQLRDAGRAEDVAPATGTFHANVQSTHRRRFGWSS